MNQVVLAIALPLLGAFLLPLLHRVSSWLAAATAPLLLVSVALVLARSWQSLDHPVQVALGGFAPPLGISLRVDGLALLFALIVPLAMLLLWHWGRTRADVHRQSLMLLLAAACSGLALSGDLFNLYVFYELAAVASYGLVAAGNTPAGYAAAIRYLMISALGSVIALLGVAIVYFKTGTLNLDHLATMGDLLAGPEGLLAFGFILIGFGVKAELFPVNGWVSEVYGAAPTRVSGLLAGLVSKLALLVVVRLLLGAFPAAEARELLLLLGTLGLVGGELAAWRARDLRRTLALSSAGQLGLIFIAFSLPGQTGLVAGLAVALHHLVVKPGLFLLAASWGGSLTGLRGAALRSPLAGVLFVLFALSLVGLPPLPGFWAKWLVLGELAVAGSGLHLLAMGAILIATVVEAAYLFRIITTLYLRDGPAPTSHPHRLSNLGGSALLALTLVVTTFSVDRVWTGLSEVAGQALVPAISEREAG